MTLLEAQRAALEERLRSAQAAEVMTSSVALTAREDCERAVRNLETDHLIHRLRNARMADYKCASAKNTYQDS